MRQTDWVSLLVWANTGVVEKITTSDSKSRQTTFIGGIPARAEHRPWFSDRRDSRFPLASARLFCSPATRRREPPRTIVRAAPGVCPSAGRGIRRLLRWDPTPDGWKVSERR